MRVTAAILAVLTLTTAAAAADLIVDEPPVAVAPEAPWDGAYVGIHAGGLWGTEEDNFSDVFVGGDADSFDLSGWLLGLHAGANMQMDSFVLGLEGVVDVTSLEGSADYIGPPDGTLTFASDWQASLNVRAGYAVDTLLFYGSLGVAIADGTLTDDNEQFGVSSDTNTHVGWTVAAGVEYMFDPNWIGRIEARYSDFGDADYDLGYADPVTASFTTTALTVGLSYKF